MNTTGRVLFVRGSSAEERELEALEEAFDVVVVESPLEALKLLSTEPTPPGCLVVPATVSDPTLETFLSRIERGAPDLATVVVGTVSDDRGEVVSRLEADAYVPTGRASALADRVGALISEEHVERVIGRHRRLERAVKSIAVDLTAAADRAAVESAVHDRLIESDAYPYVWVARRTEDGTLEVRVPVAGRLDAGALGDLVAGGDPDFVSRAVDTGQVVRTEGQVPIRRAVADSPAPPADLEATGTLASATVPFVNDGRVRGVCLVSTARSDAFDGAERELLSDVGAIVGHALWALESGAGQPWSDPGRGMENLVHDLRNPLGVARAHLAIAREDEVPESFDRVQSALGRMEETIDRVAEGVGGKPRAEEVPVDLGSVVEVAWESIGEPSASLDVADSTAIRADRELLVRMLANLFQNAVDHGGADVTVRVGTLRGGFFVEDDGPGVPAEDRTAVFERGYSTSDDGLGIGLSIVRDVASVHGWRVSVTAAETGGARFEVTGVEGTGADATV